MKYFILFSAFLGVSTAAFSYPDKDTSVVMLDTVSVKGEAGAPEYRASATRYWDIKHTQIALSFNWQEKTAEAREWVTMHPYYYPTNKVEFDAKGMKIDSVMLVGKKRMVSIPYKYVNNKLNLSLGREYHRWDTLEFYFKYTAMPYASATGGSGAITDDRGLYFINTDFKTPHKPAMIWTQGETESNSHWMITIDKPNTRFTTQIELTVADTLTTLSNGAMIRQAKGRNGMRTDIWRMDMPIQAYVAMFSIGKFSVVKDHWRKKEVNYYVEPEYERYAKLMFSNTPEMITFYSGITGVPFPWNKYSQVVVRDYVSGAMENTSAALFGEFMNQNARENADQNTEDIVSHELFHEWFGDYVTCESWSNITVNESFANYGEQLWRRYKYGKDYSDSLAWGDLQIYFASAQMHDPALVRFDYNSREDVFDGISYNKGGAILHYMNYLMGDSAFYLAMNLYLTKNALHSAEAHNWRLAVEDATGEDWNWFFNQWYYRGGHPILKVENEYNDSLQKLYVVIKQVQDDSSYQYNLPLDAAIIYGNTKTIERWVVRKHADTFVYNYKNGVKPVVVPDCGHVVPAEFHEHKKMWEWLAEYENSSDYVSKREAVTAAGKLMSDSSAQVMITMALSDPLSTIRSRALSFLENAQSDKYKRKWKNKVMDMATNDTRKGVRADAIIVLGAWKLDAAKAIFEGSVYDSSYAVAGAALSGLAKLNKDTAYIFARKLVDTHPRGGLERSVWSVIGKEGVDGDIALYEQYGPYFLGHSKFSLFNSLDNYLKNVKSNDSYKRGIEVFAELIGYEENKESHISYGGMLFQTASELKDKTTSGTKEEADVAKTRLAMLKAVAGKMTAEETEPEAKKSFEKMMKVFSD